MRPIGPSKYCVGWFLPLMAALTWGCGDLPVDEDPLTSVADGGADGNLDFGDSGVSDEIDTVVAADAEEPVDAGEAPDATEPVDTGTDAADAGVILDCPGGPMCDCDVNGDCDNAQCIDTPKGRQCAEPCIDSCSDEVNFKCTTVDSTGGDVTTICVPKYGRMCDPCLESKACKSLGLSDSLCVAHGAGGSFCGTACEIDAECSEGFLCKEVQSVEKVKGKQCVPKPAADSSAEFGDCTCSTAAVKKKLQTTCFIESVGQDGKISLCEGKRTCLVAGLTGCTAPKPEAEVCDGIDNDCDGETDELTCDDNNACTQDACKSGGNCIHVDLSNAPCNADDNVCTAGDTCQQGLCIPGGLKDCDDGNPCTKDACDIAAGCTKTHDDGAPCDDDNPCTLSDTCAAGVCHKGTPKDCSSGNDCVADSCDPATGGCGYVDQVKGTPCNNGNVCTVGDSCSGNTCLAGGPADCNDGNACTTDSCTANVGCKHANNAGPCDDGGPCTPQDFCKDSKCLAGPVKVCDDNEGCTADSCDPQTGNCLFLGLPLEASPCNADNSACTVGDACKGGKCAAGAAVPCDDKNECTADSCVKATGLCVFDAAKLEDAPCNADGSKCTKSDACKAGKCEVGLGLVCDDGNSCTDDSCEGQAGCQHKPNTAFCDDGDACTMGNLCKDSKCQPGVPTNCDDNNVCTTDGCDSQTGCVVKANVGQKHPCYDGNPANTKDVGPCKGGVATCDEAGKLGACVDQVLPKAEACDGIDNNCNGSKDEGCKAGLWEFTVVPVQLSGQGGGKTVSGNGGRALMGSSAAQAGGKHGVSWSLWDWLGNDKAGN